eukprot:15813975-Heterocapsa_arctica.AAC.1
MMLTAVMPEHEQMSIASEGFGSFDTYYPPPVVEGGAISDPDPRRPWIDHFHDQAGEVAEARKVLVKPL